jgi:hypothetical protein
MLDEGKTFTFAPGLTGVCEAGMRFSVAMPKNCATGSEVVARGQ